MVVAAAAGLGAGNLIWDHGSQTASGPVATRQQAPSSSQNGSSQNGSSQNGSHGHSQPGGTGSGNGHSSNGNGSGGNSGSGNGSGRAVWPPFLIPGGGAGGFGGGAGPSEPQQGNQTQQQSGSVSSAPGAPSNVSSIAKKVDKGVVDIDVGFTYQHAAGAGTGIVLTSDGEVLTNNHVIDGATSISVTDRGNGKTYSATVVGYDPSADVAVLQLADASGLSTASIGDSSELATGDPVVSIGNAGGVGGTPSAAGGKVTGLDKSISVGDEMYGTTAHLKGLIETNADIEPGDSGGPMVTKSGDVVGMNTAASVGHTAASTGHDGYAIPIDTATTIAKKIESGKASSTIHVGKTAALGLLIKSGSSANSGSALSGAVVAGVIADGAAASAGLAVGDVITSFDGHTISSPGELTAALLGYQPGQSVAIGWTDANGGTHHSTVTLGTGPAA